MKDNTFIITIPKLKLFGYHGCYDKEKEEGQEFEINMRITIQTKNTFYDELDLRDSLDNTLDYTWIASQIENHFNRKRYNLLEELAYNMAQIPASINVPERPTNPKSHLRDNIASVSVKIKKFNPEGMHVPYVEVECIKSYLTNVK